MKYIFKQIDTYTPSETTVEFTADSLPKVLEQFEMFLRGSGFFFDGTLDFIDHEEQFKELMELEKEPHEWVQDKKADAEWPFSPNIYEGDLNSPSAAAFQHTVNSLMNPPKFRVNSCEVCGLDRSMMKSHNCYDDNCPVHAPKSVSTSEA